MSQGFVARRTQPVSIADGANLDAFSRVRTSNPALLFSTTAQYNAAGLQMEGGATGTGVAPAHSASTRMVALSATAGTGTSYLQSFQYLPYQAGRSQLIFVTGLLGAGVAGAVVDVGLFDAGNGIFLRQNGTSGLQWVLRSSTSGGVVNNAVAQADWNLDKLDGTGSSGITLDEAKVFILVIDAQFLGMGRVRVGFDIDGQIVYCHEYLHANLITTPYMQTLTLPVQMLLTASSTAGAKTCYFKCANVSSEGGFDDELGFGFSTPEMTVTAGSGARTHIGSIRPATTFNSITNRQFLRFDSVELLVTGNFPVFYEIVLGATFSAAPTWTATNATYSGTEYTSTAGTLSTAPLVIQSGYAAVSASTKASISAKSNRKYPLTLDRAGAQRALGTLSIIVTGIGGASAARCAINYTEIR